MPHPTVASSRPPVAAFRWPLPLPPTGWGAADAIAALTAAADQLPVPVRPTQITVVSALTTVLLRTGDHAAKVYPPGTDPAHLDRVTGALAGSTTAHTATLGPVTTGHGVVTLSPWLTATRPVPWPELGGLLRAFHTDHADAGLPRWTPLSRLPAQVAGLPEDTAAVLLTARGALLAALEEVGSVLGEGTIHGDVSVRNALGTTAGSWLIDLDRVAHGPREYDLAGAARRVRAGAIDAATYAAFCDAYGFDVRTWPGLELLDTIADLSRVVFRLWDCRRRGTGLGWVTDELGRWRTPL